MLMLLGRGVFRARWLVVVVWVLLFGVSAIFSPRVSGVLRGGGYTIGSSQSVDAYNTLHRAFGYRSLTFTAVFTGPQAERDRLMPAAHQFTAAAHARYGKSVSLAPPRWSPDHRLVFERIFMSPQSDFGASLAGTLQRMLGMTGVRTYLTGPAAIYHDMETVSDSDLRRIEIVTLPIALAVLLLIFGSVVASIVPVLMAPVAVSMALAVVYFVSRQIDMSIFVLNTTSMLGLGVAIDYSLFMVHRFRQELEQGRSREDAVANTVATSGRAILVSALVVSVGFFGLTLSGVSMLSSLGIGGSIVTAFSLLAALTLLPAILGILGPRINLLPVVPRRLSSRNLWNRLARRVMRAPIPIIGAVIVVIGILSIPAFHLKVGIPGPEILPPSVGARGGNDLLNQHLGVANEQAVLVVVQRETAPVNTFQAAAFGVLDRICSSKQVIGISAIPNPDSSKQIRSCNASLAALQHASGGRAAAAAARSHRVALLSVFLRSNPSSVAAERYVSALRRSKPIPGYRILIGGQTAGQMDFDNYLYSHFPLVVIFVTATIFVVLLLAFRSLLLPLKAILMNIFSVLAAYGATVFAFQDAHLAGILGFTPVGNIDSIVPVFLFCVLFGVSTDYEVFLLTRVQEEYLLTGDNVQSVATGLEITGRIITSAAAVMVVVFGAFAFARLVVIKEVGLGLAVAVLVDATLIRALLVPATMRVLGRWNWWLPVRGFPRVSGPVNNVDVGRSPAAE